LIAVTNGAFDAEVLATARSPDQKCDGSTPALARLWRFSNAIPNQFEIDRALAPSVRRAHTDQTAYGSVQWGSQHGTAHDGEPQTTMRWHGKKTKKEKQMKTEIAVLVNEVKKRLAQATNDEDNVHLIFLNRYGDVDYVSTEDDNSDDNHSELAMRAGSPCWEICTVRPSTSEVFVQSDWHSTEELTDELLSETIEGVVAERIRFYTEREEILGASVWPR
jgi:hypothetical protein